MYGGRKKSPVSFGAGPRSMMAHRYGWRVSPVGWSQPRPYGQLAHVRSNVSNATESEGSRAGAGGRPGAEGVPAPGAPPIDIVIPNRDADCWIAVSISVWQPADCACCTSGTSPGSACWNSGADWI